jgi:hypothetical protein
LHERDPGQGPGRSRRAGRRLARRSETQPAEVCPEAGRPNGEPNARARVPGRVVQAGGRDRRAGSSGRRRLRKAVTGASVPGCGPPPRRARPRAAHRRNPPRCGRRTRRMPAGGNR